MNQKIEEPNNDAMTPEVNETLPSILQVAGIPEPEPVMELNIDEPIQTTPFTEWQANPDNTNLCKAVKSFNPLINQYLIGLGSNGDPQMEAKARIITAKALQTYAPTSGASPKTWVYNSLRQLTREKRKSNNTIAIPEGVQLDAYTLYRSEQNFIDKNDREPTLIELADMTKLSPKRIEKIRLQMKPVANENSYSNDDINLLQGSSSDFSKDAQDYVYMESDYIDKKLIEYMTGYGGVKLKDTKEIMDKLHLTPVQLTRRRARLGIRLKKLMDNLEEVQ